MTKKGGKKGSAKGGGGGPKHKKQNEQKPELQPLPMHERMEMARPMWESLPQHERVKLLTLDLQLLRDKAHHHHHHHATELTKQQQAELEHHTGDGAEFMVLEPSLDEVLCEAVHRLLEHSTWKLWTWPTQPLPNEEQRKFFSVEAFRQHLVEHHIRKDLVRFLPRDDPNTSERPAEKAFRQRMEDLLMRLQQLVTQQMDEQSLFGVKHAKNYSEVSKQLREKEPACSTIMDQRPIEQQSVYRRRRHHAADAHTALHDSNIEMVNIILEALEKESEVLFSTVVNPIITYIMEVLPEEQRKTYRSALSFEDLGKLMAEDVAHIMEWLTEKVDALATCLKFKPTEWEMEEEEVMLGDEDVWVLTPEGDALTVNPKWLQHLQGWLLDKDGCPRKAKPSEDPNRCGLMLAWVYGSIVSTAEKARDGAKHPLGHTMPAPKEGHAALVHALEEQQMWESKLQQAKELLGDMLKSRMEVSELASQYNISAVPHHTEVDKVDKVVINDSIPDHAVIAVLWRETDKVVIDNSIPDQAIIAMLRREVLLTNARLHFLVFEHLQQERMLHTYLTQMKQGEPEFDRLKRELDEVKQNHRAYVDGTYRSQSIFLMYRCIGNCARLTRWRCSLLLSGTCVLSCTHVLASGREHLQHVKRAQPPTPTPTP